VSEEQAAMRIIIIPDTPEFWIIAAVVVLVIVGIALFRWLRPPLLQKLLEDARYQQALGVYADSLPHEELTRDNRRQAVAVAIQYLEKEHGIPPDEAGPNVRLVVAEHDRERSYELRHEALAYEQAGAYDLALDYFERAAVWQEEHDPKDYQFLQRCIARVRGKVRPG
jgi:tetratricopeptide (TPR) repeat protein